MPPAATLVAFTDHMDSAWMNEVNPVVDVLFDDDSHDGPCRLRVFVNLPADAYSGGNQPVSAELRRILGGAESCIAINANSPSDDALCASVASQNLASDCAAAGSGQQCSYSAAYSPADALARSPDTPFESELLRTVAVPATSRRDEWHQLLADFYVLPQERPCVLRLQLHAGGQYRGFHVGPPGPIRNVAWLSSVTSSGSEHYTESEPHIDRAVPDSILTNGRTQGEQWLFLDMQQPGEPENLPEEITIQVDIGTIYHVCSFRVEWIPSALLKEWTLDILGGSSGDTWVNKLNVVHDLDSGGVVDAHLMTPYYFACAEATQLRFTMKRSQTFAYGLRELELYGYEVAEHGPCVHICQHGSGCWDARDGCTCVPSWFWRGDTCATDCTVPLSTVDFCGQSNRERCWERDGLCGACTDGFTVSELGPDVSEDNTPCQRYVEDACGDPGASNYQGLAHRDDRYGCEYSEVDVNEAQEEAATETVAAPDEPFSLSVPSVVIFILVGLFVGVIACFIVLHNRHSKRARVHNVDPGSAGDDAEQFDEDELDEEAAARAARDRYLASQKSDGDDESDALYAEDDGDPYAHLASARQARAKQKAMAAARANEDMNSSMSYPSSAQARGRASKKGKHGKHGKQPKGAWVPYVDDETGDTYYHNETTDEVTWDKPAELR